MSVFVDASALIAIVARESESLAMLDRLQVDSNRLCSAISVWETVAGL
jgi:ribonuclease VapC